MVDISDTSKLSEISELSTVENLEDYELTTSSSSTPEEVMTLEKSMTSKIYSDTSLDEQFFKTADEKKIVKDSTYKHSSNHTIYNFTDSTQSYSKTAKQVESTTYTNATKYLEFVETIKDKIEQKETNDHTKSLTSNAESTNITDIS